MVAPIAPTASAPPPVPSGAAPRFSVVVPVRDEADNVGPLIAEIRIAMAAYAPYEIVFIDDGSRDRTPENLKHVAGECRELRVIRHREPAGQTAAIVTGVRHARGEVIVTLDGDGQNDPADIPTLLARFGEAADRDRLLVTGLRVRRMDSWLKRVSSRIANAVRAWLLGDATPDTGCGLKVLSRRAFLAMPAFDHMHRFLPALMLRQGGEVVSVPVSHRPRRAGATKYGVLDRLGVGIVDLIGVKWLMRRAAMPVVETEDNDRGRGA
ncbi:MAG: glycosyltransferase family 2 protein [Rhodospirillales bacterium]|nr:glycosyltransferase family 2 protein [Rhodospirillales bacterium]